MESSIQMAPVGGGQTLAIVVGIFVNDSLVRKFRGHMDDRFDQMVAKWRDGLVLRESGEKNRKGRRNLDD